MEGQQKEIVFTYRQADQIEPVQLRYERDLPPCMQRREPLPVFDSSEEEEEDYLAPWRSAIAPPERIRRENRWGVRLFVGLSLLIGLMCLGAGVWYVGQYGWALPPAQDSGEPADGEDYYWDRGEVGEGATTIARYPAGGEARLTLSGGGGLTPLEPGDVYEKVNPSVVTVVGRSRQDYLTAGTGVIFSEDGYILTN